MAEVHPIRECRLCYGTLSPTVLSLGQQPISNRLPRIGDTSTQPVFPLEIVLCDVCGLAQLAHNLLATEHFNDDYVYLSGASATWVEHCQGYAEGLVKDQGVAPGDFVVEAGSNDGTLLKAFRRLGVRTLGVEPSGNVAEIARADGVETMTAFFNSTTASEVRTRYGAPKAFIGNNVLAHVPDTNAFLIAARDLIADDGFLCFEFPHFRHILDRRYFDTIYHEHYVYLGVGPLMRWAALSGMVISAVEQQTTHGGSLRVFLRKREPGARPSDVVRQFLEDEEAFAGEAPWRRLGEWLEDWRTRFRALVEGWNSHGVKVAGYAAASKATVICNFLGLTDRDVAYCCDGSSLKQGRMIPGTGIPILPPETLRENPADVVIVFAWNIFDEIAERARALAPKRITLVRPLPDVELIGDPQDVHP